ncbi:hypothetical protein OROHE_025317 [Orobanche hederae]
MPADEEIIPANAAEQRNAADEEIVPANAAEQSNAAEDDFVPENAAKQRKAIENTNANEEHAAAVESEGEEEEAGAEESGDEEEELQEEIPEIRGNPNMELKVKWKYIRHMLMDEYHKVQMTMEEDFIEVIRCRLESSGEKAVEGLRASAFGNYLKYKDHIAKSQKCICYVVSRQVLGVPDPDENALWFKINGEVIRFSKVEFALVTGLRFGTSQFNPYEDHDIPETSLYTRLFKNEKITSIHLWNLFKSKDFHIESAADCIKLCKVTIAAHVVLGNDPCNWKIPDWVWVLVEDEQVWDRFPWGSMSFQILHRAVNNVKKKTMATRSFHLHANTLALLGWIYEALPEVGMEIGGLRGDYQGEWPRGLKFEYEQSYSKVDISEVHGVLEPTLMEELSDYYVSVETKGSSFALKYIPGYEKSKGRARKMENRQVSPPAEPSHRRASVDEIPYDASTRTGDAESREDADVLAAAREASRDEAEKVAVEKRKREVAEISEEVTKKVKAEIHSPEFIQMLANAIVSLLPGIASTGAGEIEQQAGEKERGLFLEKSAGAGDKQAQIDGRMSRENEASTDNEAVTSSHIQKGLLLEQPLWSQLPNTQEIAAQFAWNYDIHHNVFGGESPYSTQETQSSIPTTCEKTVHTAEDEIQPRPVRKKFPAAVLKSPFRVREYRGTDFDKYMQNKDAEKRNVGLPFAVGKDYFEYIKDVTKELEHMHMEPYVAILAKDPHIAKVHGAQKRFVAMGVQFQKAMEDVWKAMHGEKPEGWVPDHKTEEVIPAEHMEHLEQFAEGLLPEWGGLKNGSKLRSWSCCATLISKHWAVCTIHFKTCMVILWDSNEHKFNDHIRMLRKNALLPLRRILPQLLKHIGYYNSNPVPHKYTEWPLYFPLNSANKLHQRDSVSCGPLALKSMENRLADIPDKMMYKKNLPAWRAHIAETIYNYSTHERTIAD